MSKDKGNIGEKKKLLFPKGIMGTGYQLQSLGNRELSVEGCKGILQYEQEEIRLNVGSGQVKVLGRNLSIPVLERNYVQIEGFIIQIEFL